MVRFLLGFIAGSVAAASFLQRQALADKEASGKTLLSEGRVNELAGAQRAVQAGVATPDTSDAPRPAASTGGGSPTGGGDTFH